MITASMLQLRITSLRIRSSLTLLNPPRQCRRRQLVRRNTRLKMITVIMILFPDRLERISRVESHDSNNEFTEHILQRSSSLREEFYDEEIVTTPETDPSAAKRLHKQILRMVRELVNDDEDRVRDFQDQTKDYGRDKITGATYCSFLLGALGAKQCCELIPMMVRLLPDEEKRHELLDARSAIVRRQHRRHRRRSKQFSESVVLQQQHAPQQADMWSSSGRKMRPKSDSLAALGAVPTAMVGLEGIPRSNQSLRNSMVEARQPWQDAETTDASSASSRWSLPDARRKLESRQSLTMFGETIDVDPIEEENPSSWESDDHDTSHDEQAHELPPENVKSLPPVFQRLQGNPWVKPSSAASEPHTGTVTQPLARPMFGRQTSDAEQLDPVQGNPDENPVLARLRKQGAVNFMLR
ncbi:hypothetical protein PINS_up013439 [Pythium insidiosum]|nr:hypothetical protein PINS_up013439 [Pythium insidiosum]